MRSKRGRFVALVGPDGVGKTTLADMILARAEGPAGYVHFRPRPFRSLPARPNSLQVAAPDKHPPEQRILGWLRLLAAIPRFWLGYLTSVRPLLLKGGTIVADRWAYGYVAQPRALRFFGPAGLARFVVGALPRPDLVFNLIAPADVIAARKGELTEEEIVAELQRWKSVPAPNVITIDAAQSPSELVLQVLAELESI